MKKIRLSRLITATVLVLFGLSVVASFYFFHVAQVRDHKSFIDNKPRKQSSPLYEEEQAFLALQKENLTMTNQGLKQVAWYVPAAEQTDKTVIIVHGFGGSKEKMAIYGWLFHQEGYNVLMPDNVAAGESQGNIIGYGWNDRMNVIKWADILVERNPDVRITLYGLSMGGATVMMASGEKSLPKEVTTIIEDAGYTSVWDELVYQAKDMYGLPAFPLVYEVSSLSKIRAGFSYGEASSLKQLAKNTRPILFIHGDKDTFVPTSMVYDNYAATKSPKSIYIVKGAGHAKTFETDKVTYQATIHDFLKKYAK